MKTPEKYRLKKHPKLGSDSSYGNNGFFIIPHYKIDDYDINCQISDGNLSGGDSWEHVSVTISSKKRKVERCPTWDEMCFVKNVFWNEDECVVQYHPPKSQHVSMHHYCLHLWKKVGYEFPLPDSMMVGINP